MRNYRSGLAAVAAGVIATLAALNFSAPTGDGNWPSFRGPDARGIATTAVPTTWNVETGENIRWKTSVPGLGHSSPVIWGDRIFLTSAISGDADPYLKVGLYGDIAPVTDTTAHKWMVYCFDKKSGKLLWERLAHEGVPAIKRHTKSTHANSTPATDGKHLVVFLGSEGLYCYDLDGKLLWQKDFGVLDSGFFMVPQAQWGFASSPIIHNGTVIIQCDVQENSFVAALRVSDGTELWRTPRQEVPTWSTPAVHTSNGRTQVIVNGWKHIGGYDFATGQELWKLTGGGDIPVPTPIVAHDLIFITNAHGRYSPIYAIQTDASGDISLAEGATSNDAIAWSIERGGAYMQTPLVYGDYLYNCRDNGVLSCYDAKSGERLYQERLGGGRTGITASAVAADGKLYYTGEFGDVFVVKAGPEFELLAENSMGEVCMATPAISGGVLYVRTQKHLVAIGAK